MQTFIHIYIYIYVHFRQEGLSLPRLLRLDALPAATLEKELRRWEINTQATYTIDDVPQSSNVLALLSSRSALPGSIGIDIRDELARHGRDGFDALLAKGYAVEDAEGRALLTPEGMRKCKSFLRVHSDLPVSCIREAKPLTYFRMTSLELVESLTQPLSGWTLQRWLSAELPPPLTSGSQRWYVKASLSRWYMLVLLHSRALFELGVTEIPHLQVENHYKKYFRKGKPCKPPDLPARSAFRVLQDEGIFLRIIK